MIKVRCEPVGNNCFHEGSSYSYRFPADMVDPWKHIFMKNLFLVIDCNSEEDARKVLTAGWTKICDVIRLLSNGHTIRMHLSEHIDIIGTGVSHVSDQIENRQVIIEIPNFFTRSDHSNISLDGNQYEIKIECKNKSTIKELDGMGMNIMVECEVYGRKASKYIMMNGYEFLIPEVGPFKARIKVFTDLENKPESTRISMMYIVFSECIKILSIIAIDSTQKREYEMYNDREKCSLVSASTGSTEVTGTQLNDKKLYMCMWKKE